MISNKLKKKYRRTFAQVKHLNEEFRAMFKTDLTPYREDVTEGLGAVKLAEVDENTSRNNRDNTPLTTKASEEGESVSDEQRN